MSSTPPIRVGIGGWTFEPWRGVFFPDGLPHAREMAYAASKMSAIEVNGTYYSTFKPETFRKWAAAAPEDFVFALKASRFCTNRKVLAEAGESIDRFLGQGIDELGAKLGPILWQFMPTKKFDRDDFGAFFRLLPEKRGGLALRHAIEVRHESFEDAAFLDLARDAGAAVVFADKQGAPTIDEKTADFSYARLQSAEEAIETGYSGRALDAWADRARGWAKGGRDVFVFMINGAKVRAPAAALALRERLE